MQLFDRRTLLTSWHALVGFIVALGAAPAGLFFGLGARRREGETGTEGHWVDLGPETEIPDGPWRARRFRRTVQDRWKTSVVDETVYVRRSGATIEAVSSVCTHTGCLVQRLSQGFACPCHKSDFDEEGKPLGGPAPRPLDRLEAKLDGERIKVRFQRFRPGLGVSEPMSA
jgi:Rieske Fe-S protein